MARKFLDDIRAAIDSQMPDNTVGAITPAIMRATLKDVIDSTIQDEAALLGNVTTSVTATPTWTPVPAAFWTSVIGGDATFLKMSQGAGTITGATVAGWSYTLQGVANLEAQNNADIEFAIGRGGAQFGQPITVTGRGAGRPIYARCFCIDISAQANSVYQLLVRSPTGANETISIINGALIGTINPTNNP